MRLLIALALIQSVLLGIVGVKVIALDARSRDLARTPAVQVAEQTQAPAPYSAGGVTADEIRAIVRDEIAILAQGGAATAGYAAKSAPQPIVSRAEAARQKANVRSDLDAAIGRGEIGEAEMATLQTAIAALPAAERQEMLSRLTKALNSGRLKGQL